MTAGAHRARYNLQNHSLIPESPCYPQPIQIFSSGVANFLLTAETQHRRR